MLPKRFCLNCLSNWEARATAKTGTATRYGRPHRYRPAQPGAVARLGPLQQPWPGASAIARFPRHLRVSEALDGSTLHEGPQTGPRQVWARHDVDSARCWSLRPLMLQLRVLLRRTLRHKGRYPADLQARAMGTSQRRWAGCRPDSVRLRRSGQSSAPLSHQPE